MDKCLKKSPFKIKQKLAELTFLPLYKLFFTNHKRFKKKTQLIRLGKEHHQIGNDHKRLLEIQAYYSYY